MDPDEGFVVSCMVQLDQRAKCVNNIITFRTSNMNYKCRFREETSLPRQYKLQS